MNVQDVALLFVGLTAVAAGTVLIYIAVVVMRARTRHPLARRLVLTLAVEGVAPLAFGSAAVSGQLFPTEWVSEVFLVLVVGALLALPFTHIRFLFGLPLAWFAKLRGRLVDLVLASGLVVLWFFAARDEDVAIGALLFSALTSLALFAIYMEIYRRPPAELTKKDAKLLATAFAVREGSWVVLLLFVPALASLMEPLVPAVVASDWLMYAWVLLWPLSLLAFASLLARGALQSRLFGRKLGRIFSRSARGLFVVAMGFLVAETSAVYLGAKFGWILGGLAGGAALFAVFIIERWWNRLESSVPHPLRVYENVVRAALLDGRISSTDRDLLAALKFELALGDAEAKQAGDRAARRGRT